MTAVLLPQGKQQYFTAAGVPLVGGKVFTYDAGTTNPRTTWADAGQAAPNTNPVILDARGEAIIFWAGAYKVVLKDSLDNTIWTVDGVSSVLPTISQSLIPDTDNAYDLGSAAFAWRQLYLGPNGTPALDVAGNIIYMARTAAEILRGVVPTRFSAQPGDVRYGERYAQEEIAYQALANREGAHYGRVDAASLPRLFKAIYSQIDGAMTAINFVGFGSSVGAGATLPDPTTQAPSAYFYLRFKALFDPMNMFSGTAHYNHSVNGHALADLDGDVTTAIGAGHTPRLAIICMGMNDASPFLYNAGQTYPACYQYLNGNQTGIVNEIARLRALGSDVIIVTSPHEATSRSAYNLGAVVPQSYPTAVPAPVNPVTQMIPNAAASIVTADICNLGSNINFSYRMYRVNQAMRQAAADAQVPCIDAERYWLEARYRYTEDQLFDPGEVVHPNLLGHQLSYHRAIEDFLQALLFQSGQPGTGMRAIGSFGINAIAEPTAGLDVTPKDNAVNVEVLRDITNTARRTLSAGGLQRWLPASTNADAARYVGNDIDNGGNANASLAQAWNVGGLTGKQQLGAHVNIGPANVDVAVPASTGGYILIYADQPGIGRQSLMYGFVNSAAAVVTISAALFNLGPVVVTVTASGTNVRINAASANTTIRYELRQW